VLIMPPADTAKSAQTGSWRKHQFSAMHNVQSSRLFCA
jgi:hypothetical protein